jgi:cytochrome P450
VTVGERGQSGIGLRFETALNINIGFNYVLQIVLNFNRLSPGQKWHTHRKMITPTFHFKILDTFVEVFSEKSKILISKLQKEVGSTGFDVYPYITHCALDIICGE